MSPWGYIRAGFVAQLVSLFVFWIGVDDDTPLAVAAGILGMSIGGLFALIGVIAEGVRIGTTAATVRR